MKTCSHCKRELDVTLFNTHKFSRDGLSSWCKECKATLQRETNRKKGKKERHRRDPELLKQGLKLCLSCNAILPIRMFSPAKRGYAGCSAYCKDCFRSRFKADTSTSLKRVKKYRSTSDSWKVIHRGHQHCRRLRVQQGNSGLVTAEVLKSLYAIEICSYCQKHIEPNRRTIDHVVALAKGGLHHPDNLVMACGNCNSEKSTKDVSDYLQRKRSQ